MLNPTICSCIRTLEHFKRQTFIFRGVKALFISHFEQNQVSINDEFRCFEFIYF